MSSPVTIAVDAMGGDLAPRAAVEGSVAALSESPCSLVLVGDADALERELERHEVDEERLRVVHAEEVVGMEEPAITPLRKKRRSSIRVTADLVRSGEAQGMFSAGNTGAAMISAKVAIGMIEGVDRPALSAVMPTLRGSTLVLDVGANVDSKAEYLRQFAVMGHSYAKQILDRPSPRIGLLSIGEEEGKGTELTREVFKLMESASLNFAGNVEGRDIFAGTVDVIICDGFVGNVMLKSAESLAELILHFAREELGNSWRGKLGYLLARPAFKRLQRRMDYSEYGAATLLGVQGSCFIGHGSSNAKAVKISIVKAAEFSAAELHAKMRDQIAELHRLESEIFEKEGPV